MTDSTILSGVIADLRAREAKGIQTYGTTLETAALSELELLTHLYEEILDSALYTKALIEKKRNEKITSDILSASRIKDK